MCGDRPEKNTPKILTHMQPGSERSYSKNIKHPELSQARLKDHEQAVIMYCLSARTSICARNV
jgi:hypothetical protein